MELYNNLKTSYFLDQNQCQKIASVTSEPSTDARRVILPGLEETVPILYQMRLVLKYYTCTVYQVFYSIHITEQFSCTFCEVLGTYIGDYPT